jgi:hypothetical protein
MTLHVFSTLNDGEVIAYHIKDFFAACLEIFRCKVCLEPRLCPDGRNRQEDERG